MEKCCALLSLLLCRFGRNFRVRSEFGDGAGDGQTDRQKGELIGVDGRAGEGSQFHPISLSQPIISLAGQEAKRGGGEGANCEMRWNEIGMMGRTHVCSCLALLVGSQLPPASASAAHWPLGIRSFVSINRSSIRPSIHLINRYLGLELGPDENEQKNTFRRPAFLSSTAAGWQQGFGVGS